MPRAPSAPRDASRPVRIVVAEPAAEGGGPGLGTTEALRRLGRRVRIEVAHDADAALELVRSDRVDLVVVDRRLAAEGLRILAALRAEGPPVLVVTPEATADVALETFQAGAADCVTASGDYAEVLPAVALEQIRAWRTSRERERLTRQARDLRLALGQIVESMESGLLLVGPDGRVNHGNPAAERIFGEASGALVGRAVEAWFPEDSPDDARFARALRSGERVRGAEAVAVRADGRYVPVGLSVAPLPAVDDAHRVSVVIFQDLSELKQLQRQVVQTEKMASIGQLAAGVAHEINNPMGFVHANLFQMDEYVGDLRRLVDGAVALAETARRDGAPAVRAAAEAWTALAGKLDLGFLLDDLGKAIRESLEGSERVRHIIQDLRSFAHRDDGEWVSADLNRCLDSTAHIVWTMMKHSVVLRKEYAALPPVRCRPLLLEQVFMNLLVNAYQAIEQRVSAGGGTGEIVLRTQAVEEQVRVSVADDGVGIAPENVDRIFDPFFTTKEVGVGTGLGLSTSYEIVRRHGGTMRARARPGGGTVFEVALPVAGPPAADA
jgi:two-component system NtrC family sensor kinase